MDINITAYIFDLDQTIVDSKRFEKFRDARQWNKVYENLNDLRIYTLMIDIHNSLKANKHKISVVTSAPKTYAERVLNHIGWQVDYIIGYHDTKLKKPNPEPILLALQKMQVDVKNVISLGDRDIDIIASKAAGVKSGACLWGAENKKSLLEVKPDFIFNDTQELFEFIIKKSN